MIYFLELIHQLKVQGEDILIWKDDRRGHFSVKSYYNSLRVENNLVFLGKEIYGSCTHLRTCFFTWETVWRKVLTVDTLMKRGWQMTNRWNCCKDSEELVDCILIHYVKRRELWMFLLAIFGLVWVFPTLVRNLLLEWKVKRLDKKKRAFGAWLWFAYFGIFRKSATEGLLKMKGFHIKRLNDFFIWLLSKWS